MILFLIGLNLFASMLCVVNAADCGQKEKRGMEVLFWLFAVANVIMFVLLLAMFVKGG